MFDSARYRFEQPRLVTSLDDCWFYHAMDLPGAGAVGAEDGWDLRGRFDEYTGHVPLAGRSVLDVGTASGFLTFEAEKRGAQVISFDMASISQRQMVPSPAGADATELGKRRTRIPKMLNSYWFAHRDLGSRARVVYGDIYALAALVPACNVAIAGQILVHVRDPFAVLHQIALACTDTLIVTEGSFDSRSPTAVFLGMRSPGSWWHISNALYREWFALLGFAVESVTTSAYRCNDPELRGDVPLWTFVGRRQTETQPAITL
jgi:hypothetical protein